MKKMINILLTVSMLTSCIAVPFAANAAEPQTAIVQTSTEENFNISEKLKGDIEAGLEKIDVIIQCVIKYDVKSITAEIQNAVAEYAETLDTSVNSADEINQMIGEFKNELGDQKYQEAYSAKYQEICDYIGIDVTEAEFVGTKLSCTLTPEQIYKIADSEYIKGIVIEKSEFVSGEELGYYQVEVTDNKVEEAEKAKELFSKYIEENKLDAKVVGQETYPDYAQPIIIEFNPQTVQEVLFIKFAHENNIDRTLFTFKPIIDGFSTDTTTPKEVLKITDTGKICELFSGYIEENKLDAKVTGQEKYPDYSQPVIIEYNTQTVQNGLLLEFAEQNNIDRTLFTFVPIINGVPITTANPNGNTPTTTTTTTAVQEAQALFNKYFEENKMDARCITSENYPSNYPPLVIEYATESGTITGPMIVEFAKKNNIDRTLFTVAPTVNGVPMIAQDVDTNVKGDTNCDGQVDMADAVLIMQALANPNKYGIDGTAAVHLTERGKLNGDMDGDGLTVGDAQAIQEILLGNR